MQVVAGPSGSGKSSLFPVAAARADHFNVDDRCAELNERQAHEGLSRLEADLRALRESGIIDEKGGRLQRGPGAAPEDTTRDA